MYNLKLDELKDLYLEGIISFKQMTAIKEHAKRDIVLDCGPEFAFYLDAIGELHIACRISTPAQMHYIKYISDKLVNTKANTQPHYTAGI